MESASKFVLDSALQDIFPDIEGELESRHSLLLNRLRNSFGQVYDGISPTYFVLVQGSVDIIKRKELRMSMALENGLILLVRPTLLGNDITVNGTNMDSETTFNCTGKHKHSMNDYAAAMQKGLIEAVDDFSTSKLSGGQLYFHSTLSTAHQNYDSLIKIAFFMASLLLNSAADTYTRSELISKLSNIIPDKELLHNYFHDFQKRKFTLQNSLQNSTLQFPSHLKLIFYHFEEQVSIKESLELSEDQGQLVQQLQSKAIDLQQFIARQWSLWEKHECCCAELTEKVKLLSEKLGTKSVMVLPSGYLLVVAQKKMYTEMLRILKKELGSSKPKAQFTQQRFGNNPSFEHTMFSSSPSCGVAILDPSEELWFI